MRISDWSSVVCSSDLLGELPLGDGLRRSRGHRGCRRQAGGARGHDGAHSARTLADAEAADASGVEGHRGGLPGAEIGSASCRARGCKYVVISVVDVSWKNKYNTTYMRILE